MEDVQRAVANVVAESRRWKDLRSRRPVAVAGAIVKLGIAIV